MVRWLAITVISAMAALGIGPAHLPGACANDHVADLQDQVVAPSASNSSANDPSASKSAKQPSPPSS